MPQDNAGNSLTTAREIQLLSGNQFRSFSDRVDSSDLNDYYKFRVQGHSSFGLKLTNSGGNADVELLNANGSRLQGSVNEGSTSELINTKLEAGTYYVRVYQGNGSGTDYSLDFSTQTNVQADLLWRNSVSGQDVIWQMNGAAIASGVEIAPVKDLSWNIVASGDFNNDGQSDLVWRNSFSGSNVIWYMNGATIASGVEIAPVKDLSWNIVAAKDFNNDGQSDLVWRNSVSGANVIWYMNGATIASGVEIAPVKDLSWDIVAAADFNNDGQSDLVWRNSVSGTNVIWYMNGATIVSGVEITAVKDLSWKLVGAGDFDRDGQSDLVWRNSVSGANVVWYMNGAIVRSGVEIAAVKDLSWKIAEVAQRFEAAAAIDWVSNTSISAFNLGTLSGSNSFTESIGGGDAVDYYRFSVSNPSVVNFKLSTPNLLYDILDSVGNLVAVKDSTFITPQFKAILEAGTYYVRIRDKGSIENYTLSIEVRDNLIQKYDFSYVYNGGFSISSEAQDYYTGYFYDYAEKYQTDRFIDVNPNLNETGNNGRYLIGKSITSGTKSDLGKVYVNRYYDNETGMSFTPNGFLLNRASGTSFLGSEFDYINASSGQHNDFGQDAWEYDAKPELIATSFDIIQNNAKPGNAIAVQFSVTNKSQAFSAASNASFYLSTDRTITTTDRLLGTVSIPSLNGQLTSNLFSTNLSLPGFGDGIWYANGNYYIGMIVDSGNTIAESNEVNNSNQGVGIDLDSLAISLPSIVKIIASDPSAAEQGLDSGFFTISRTGDISQSLVVSLGIGGTAIAGTDYTSGGSTFGALTSVTFAAGQSTTLYVINPKDDALDEGNETVNVVLLASAQGNYEIDASNNNASVIILDNDSTVTLTVTDVIATERKTTEVQDPGQFRITRSGNLTSALTVNYRISGSTTNGVDYSQLSGSISFAAGQSSTLIAINILDDVIAEGTENLTLTLTAGSGYTIGSVNSGTMSVIDNDNASIVVTSLNSADVLRPGGTFNITWTDNISDNVAIHLYKGGQFISTISSSTESDGNYLWSLPTTLVYGNDYSIAVSTFDAQTYDFSNNYFSIKPDLKQYSFQYRFNPANTAVTDYYNGSVMAAEGKYRVTPTQSGGSYLISDLFNVTTTATEAGSDGRYIITAVTDYNDDLVSDVGRVFVTQYVDRDNGADRVFTPVNYQAGQASGTNYLGSELDYIDASRSLDSKFGQDYYEADFIAPLVVISDKIFSGNEGDRGSFRIKLYEAPTSDVTIKFTSGNFITVDSDNLIQNGTQDSITFNSSNWNIAKTIGFLTEKDGSSSNRTAGNSIVYTVSGSKNGAGSYDIGTVTNTYSPDTTKFNIDLDFRNDYSGYWTAARRAIAQAAADDWARLIANEYSGITVNNQSIDQIGINGNKEFMFSANRFVDDMVIFVGAYAGGDNYSGWGGPVTGSNIRLGRITVNTTDSSIDEESDLNQTYYYGDATGYRTGGQYLYSLVSHELGHTLGLLGMNDASLPYFSGNGALGYVFFGQYSIAYNGGRNIPMMNFGHPGSTITSIMSYTTGWGLSAPSEMDKRFLADSGYSVYGVNAGSPSSQLQYSASSGPIGSSPSIASANLAPTTEQVIQNKVGPQCGCTLCRESVKEMAMLGSGSLIDQVIGRV
jgi:hypothetical protein